MVRRTAKAAGADLIVVGRRERSSIARLILGGVTQSVLQNADRDALVAPAGWAARSETRANGCEAAQSDRASRYTPAAAGAQAFRTT
jgi:hypothetical protein